MSWRRRLRPRWLDTTIGQILFILIGTLLLTHFLVAILGAWLRPEDSPFLRSPDTDALQVATLIDSMRAVPVTARSVIASSLTVPGLTARIGAPYAFCGPGTASPHQAQVFSRALWAVIPVHPDIAVLPCHHPRHRVRLEIVAHDLGAVFDIDLAAHHHPFSIHSEWFRLVASVFFLFLVTSLLSVWAIRRIIGPLQRLSGAVDRFGADSAVARLPEEGAREIRHAARSINDMQARIAAALRDRTRMLAAVSHDLRTPITRMRLRTELEPESEWRAKTLRDLDLMQTMVDAALSYLRGDSNAEPEEMVDLPALLESLCDEAAEAGRDVAFRPAQPVCVRCRPSALSRAVTNLIENACRYGVRARVSLTVDAQKICIDIADDGPGIPDSRKAEALTPFARLDPARAAGQGVGLGLAIVDAIARAHGGRLKLLDAPSGGLLARLCLPRLPTV